MISYDEFENIVINKIGRDIKSNKEQKLAIKSRPETSFFIVAGPGSGKTTVMVLKVLKLIFVDDVDPSEILITTFTKKAAAELRSRILGWGDILKRSLSNNMHLKNQIEDLDINRIKTGTIDSLTEEIVNENREPGTPSPAVIEDFVSHALMLKMGLFNEGRFQKKEIKDAISIIQDSKWGLNVPSMNETLLEIKERLYHDQIDFQQLNDCKIDGIDIVCDAIKDYLLTLKERYLFDFASLENELLKKLENNKLERFLSEVKFLLVDEYQDTNLLQEKIYFQIAKACVNNGGSVTVVGDDDQSLYRFRGATVTLFQNFEHRIGSQLGIIPEKIFLSPNYRSTSNIVNFCNEFILIDQNYFKTRVDEKPLIKEARMDSYTDYPILGLFRDDKDKLAEDLAHFIHEIAVGGGYQIPGGEILKLNPDGGSPSDIAYLCSSPKELDYKNNPRLPLLLKNRLETYDHSLKVFNPRGQNLESVFEVKQLCGLILSAIDPLSDVQESIKLPKGTLDTFQEWRTEGNNFIKEFEQSGSNDLRNFINHWQNKVPLGKRKWPKRVSIMNMIYKLITWIPSMQSDIEGLVYLEAITRTVNQASLFGNFSSEIVYDDSNTELTAASIKEAYRNIFIPIATGAIKVNEDLLETLPSDRINVMSIHQSKGLEFPLVIVDVGSDFKNLNSSSIKRFPTNGGHTCSLEDSLRQYSELGSPSRSALDRAFDDLVRQYFVGFSRAQDVLLLVGLNSVKDGYSVKSGERVIPNVATGWNRNKEWIWDKGLENLTHL